MKCQILISLAICLSNAFALKILGLFPHPGNSHQRLFDSLTRELAVRGHSVTVVTHFPVKNPPPGYQEIYLNASIASHTGALSLEPYNDRFYGMDALYDSMHICWTYVIRHGIDNCDLLLSMPKVRDLYFGHETFDVILTEAFNSDCMYVFAEKKNIPVVAIETHQLAVYMVERLGQPDNPSYMPQYLLSYSDNMTLRQRFETVLIKYVQKYIYRFYAQRAEENIIKERLGISVNLEEIAKRRTKVLLSNTYHVLNRPRPLVPAIKEVSGVHLKQTLDKLDKDIEDFINESEHGVVLFSFGSLLNTSTISPDKLEAFIRVFEEIPQRVLWKYNADHLPNKPKNVKLVKWLQQQEILSHKNVRAFIAHGGLLGMTEAVHAGVPMVVLSVLGDQSVNGAAAQESGFGVSMMYREVTTEKLRQALKKVLSPEMQANVKRLSKEWRDRPMSPMDTAVFWVEFVGRNPDAQLSTKAKDLPFYTLALLDVGLLFIVLIFALLSSIYFIFKLFYLIIYGRKSHTGSKKLKTK